MKNNYKFIFFAVFAVFWLSVSSAEDNKDYLYTFSSGSIKDVTLCPINRMTGGSAGDCYEHSRGGDEVKVGEITTLAAFDAKGHYLLGKANGVLYAAGTEGLEQCYVYGWNGRIMGCKKPEVSIKNILSMAVNPYHLLYYIDKQSLGVCELGARSGGSRPIMPNNCHTIMSDLKDATSVALSSNGEFIYITEKNPSSVLICSIYGEELIDCKRNNNSHVTEPSGIAIDHIGTYAYIIDKSDSLKSCKINHETHTLEDCNNYPSAPGFGVGAKSITLNQDGRYSFISYPDKNTIVKCKIQGGEYRDCKAIINNLMSLHSLGYFKNTPHG